MANLLISYNRQSEAIVRTLAGDIGDLGHTVWVDQNLSGGQVWWDQILAQVRDCDVFVFALSPEALDSTACQREYHYAAELGKPILPVLVADRVSTNLLPPALSKIQFVDYRDRNASSAISLSRAIANIPLPGPLPDPLPKAPEVPLSYLGNLRIKIASTEPLSREDQSALVLDLKAGLRDRETAVDSRTLLQKLRERRDLLAMIAAEIDALLASAPGDSPTPSDTTIRKRAVHSREIPVPVLGQSGHGKATIASAIRQFQETHHKGWEYSPVVVSGSNWGTGASGADVGILVVSAADGPMPETQDHLRLARQNGVGSILVVLNKIDLVDDEELLELVELEIRELLCSDGFPGDDLPVIRAGGGTSHVEELLRGLDALATA